MRQLISLYLYSVIAIASLIILLAPSCAVSPEKYYYIGRQYSEKKEYLKAYKCYTRSIKLKATSQAYWERANAGIKIDSLENSIDDFTMFIGLSKNVDSLQTAFYQRANLEYKGGYKSDACDDWDNACELNLNKACDVYREKCK